MNIKIKIYIINIMVKWSGKNSDPFSWDQSERTIGFYIQFHYDQERKMWIFGRWGPYYPENQERSAINGILKLPCPFKIGKIEKMMAMRERYNKTNPNNACAWLLDDRKKLQANLVSRNMKQVSAYVYWVDNKSSQAMVGARDYVHSGGKSPIGKLFEAVEPGSTCQWPWVTEHRQTPKGKIEMQKISPYHMEEMVELFCHFMDSNIVSGEKLGLPSSLYALAHGGGAIGLLTSLWMCLKIDAVGRIQDAKVKPEYGQTFPSSGFSNTGSIDNCQFGKVPRAQRARHCGDFISNEDCDDGMHVDIDRDGSTPGECCVDDPEPEPAPPPPPPPPPPPVEDEEEEVESPVVKPETEPKPKPKTKTKPDRRLKTREKRNPNKNKRGRPRLRGNSKKREAMEKRMKQYSKLKPHRRRRSKGNQQRKIEVKQPFRIIRQQPSTMGNPYTNTRQRRFVSNKPSKGQQLGKIMTKKRPPRRLLMRTA